MTDELLGNPTHSGHLLVGALKRRRDKPVLFLGDTTLTGGQLTRSVSTFRRSRRWARAPVPRSGCRLTGRCWIGGSRRCSSERFSHGRTAVYLGPR
jgi:hypothetical protein